ncbi:uncharacterized protein LOC132263839 [Phlebotomus argentipes]|uniref:uncharacterized protein LOC132263839 n=1 Tax=Phlebotomus argentipes TaxID=94469 RepID=UPI002892D15C|nr:uncharacterized protein LOC132263839 [Phlebotomus argentipes]
MTATPAPPSGKSRTIAANFRLLSRHINLSETEGNLCDMESAHKGLYKSTAWRQKTAEEKRELFRNTRSRKRQTLFLQNRDIDENQEITETPETLQKPRRNSAKKKTPFAVKFARWKKNRDDAKTRAKREKKPPFVRSVRPGALPPLKPIERRAKFNPPAKVKPLQFAKISKNPPQIDTNFDFPTGGPITRSRAKYIQFVFE